MEGISPNRRGKKPAVLLDDQFRAELYCVAHVETVRRRGIDDLVHLLELFLCPFAFDVHSVTDLIVAGLHVRIESQETAQIDISRRLNTKILELDTFQKRVQCAIKSIGLRPKTWRLGGLGKRIEVFRLPGRQESTEFGFKLSLAGLKTGDNPIYVCVRQEDGHMAWSSPIYVVERR